jgi:glycosyltransferase involved in cell wall biosynthesis
VTSVSVVTVTFNNAKGLERTLQSLASLNVRPLEIVVVDGGSTDGTLNIIAFYQDKLPIKYLSESDNGIYDAMNKGKKLACGNFIHYLNAGDFVCGEPYQEVDRACRLPVKFIDEKTNIVGVGKISISGFGYCHQGIIFPKNYPDYDLSFHIAADFDLMIKVFPNGLSKLPLQGAGGVIYDLCGVSSKRRIRRDIEIGKILFLRRKFASLIPFAALASVKLLLPKTIRRAVRRILSGFS